MAQVKRIDTSRKSGVLMGDTRGAYGILPVDPSTEGAMICGSCGRAWMEDITPAGRCPWEWDHVEDQGT